MNLINLSLA